MIFFESVAGGEYNPRTMSLTKAVMRGTKTLITTKRQAVKAKKLRIDVTPTLFIDGHEIVGFAEFGVLKRTVEGLLTGTWNKLKSSDSFKAQTGSWALRLRRRAQPMAFRENALKGSFGKTRLLGGHSILHSLCTNESFSTDWN